MTDTDEHRLLADLAATFPGIEAHPLREFTGIPQQRGAWFANQISMPDGKPIYLNPIDIDYVEPEGYSCWVHDGFLAWLEARGWHVETYDWGTQFIVPMPPPLPAELTAPGQRLAPGEVPF